MSAGPNIYSIHQKSELKRLGFHWVESDREWYNDTGDPMSVYLDCYGNQFILRIMRYDADVTEEYEHFDTFEELVAYIS